MMASSNDDGLCCEVMMIWRNGKRFGPRYNGRHNVLWIMAMRRPKRKERGTWGRFGIWEVCAWLPVLMCLIALVFFLELVAIQLVLVRLFTKMDRVELKLQ